mmetsp:Transcript_1156/g.2311  ORF Transcript_1156/g.2311 Transcript_1156/m.2311 type:complete len:205 (-) Transcript_1156:213-827(-)
MLIHSHGLGLHSLHRRIQFRRRIPQRAGTSRWWFADFPFGCSYGCPAEIPQFQLCTEGRHSHTKEHHIFWFHILMFNATAAQVLQGQEELTQKPCHQTFRKPTLRMLPGVEIVESGTIAVLKDQHVFAIEALVALEQAQDVGMSADPFQGCELLHERPATQAVKAFDGYLSTMFSQTMRHACCNSTTGAKDCQLLSSLGSFQVG